MNSAALQKWFFRLWGILEKKLMALPFLDHPYAQQFQKHQNYVYLGLGLLLCWLSFQLNLVPRYQQLQAMKSNHAELEQQIDRIQRERERALEKQRAFADRLAKARGRLYSPQEALKFSNLSLPKLVAESGCRVESIVRQPQTQVNELLYQLPLDVKVIGQTGQVGHFLESLRLLTQTVGIKQLAMEPNGKNGLKLTSTLVLYYALQ